MRNDTDFCDRFAVDEFGDQGMAGLMESDRSPLPRVHHTAFLLRTGDDPLDCCFEVR